MSNTFRSFEANAAGVRLGRKGGTVCVVQVVKHHRHNRLKQINELMNNHQVDEKQLKYDRKHLYNMNFEFQVELIC